MAHKIQIMRDFSIFCFVWCFIYYYCSYCFVSFSMWEFVYRSYISRRSKRSFSVFIMIHYTRSSLRVELMNFNFIVLLFKRRNIKKVCCNLKCCLLRRKRMLRCVLVKRFGVICPFLFFSLRFLMYRSVLYL